MIMECPLTMECRLAQVVDLPTIELFIGEIVGAFSEEEFLSNGKLDIEKMNPFLLTMTDNMYRSIGKPIGQAWADGKQYKK